MQFATPFPLTCRESRYRINGVPEGVREKPNGAKKPRRAALATGEKIPVATRGLLIRGYDAGEDDRRLVFLTESHGLITLVGKAAKKSRKRFGGVLQRYLLLSITWVPGRGSMPILTSASILESFWGVTESVGRARCADAILGTAAAIFQEPGRKTAEIDTVCRFLRETATSIEPTEIARRSCALLLSAGGWQPNLSGCRGCGAKDEQGYWLDPAKGEIRCHGCRSRKVEAIPLSAKAVRAWASFQASPPGGEAKEPTPREILDELEYPMARYMEWHTGRKTRASRS